LDIGVLGYIGIVQHKEHSPEVLSIPPGTPCINGIVRQVGYLLELYGDARSRPVQLVSGIKRPGLVRTPIHFALTVLTIPNYK